MDLFLSNFTNRIDAKGRVSIPAPFRNVLARDGFEGLCVHPSLKAQSLDCGGSALLADIERLLAPLPTGSDQWEAFAATLYGQIEILKVDGEGRINLTEAMRDHAGITADVTFVGMARKFQIWEPSRFRMHLAEAKDRVREAQKLLGPTFATANPSQLQGARE